MKSFFLAIGTLNAFAMLVRPESFAGQYVAAVAALVVIAGVVALRFALRRRVKE